MDGSRSSTKRQKFNPFEWRIYQELKNHNLRQGRCVLAVSGGLDSMALLQLMNRMKGQLKLELEVACIFHGRSPDPKLDQFRAQAWDLVRQQSQILDLRFHSNVTEPSAVSQLAPQSEAGLREIRRQFWQDLMPRLKANWLVIAHHQDDWLETQLVRLIRGTGTQGYLGGLTWQRGVIVRPFLNASREQIRVYALEKRIQWLEDPSNQSLDPLRNWVRHQWLPQLEAKRPGARTRLSESLRLLAEGLVAQDRLSFERYATEKGIHMPEFMELSHSDQRRVLARYMNLRGIKNYTRAHIDEIMKRLRSSQRELRFTVAQAEWHVDAQHILAHPRSS